MFPSKIYNDQKSRQELTFLPDRMLTQHFKIKGRRKMARGIIVPQNALKTI
jgi:hypothetical protein